MPRSYLHDLKAFPDLLNIIAEDSGILAGLVEKDYWIMQVLHGLTSQGFSFEMKGGTSLSKGYGIIDRFSEDIDIQINPPPELNVNTNPKNTKESAINSRRNYYDWLAETIKIPGILSVARDTTFDSPKNYKSGGVRLHYKSYTDKIDGVKDGILLEAGFDTVTPNERLTISSWAYDRAVATKGIDIIDNRAMDIACYHPGYTFVEKLQTIATKFRQEQESGKQYPNLMRQYYDVYNLLDNAAVRDFIGTEDYHKHKQVKFRGADAGLVIAKADAFLIPDQTQRKQFEQRYAATKTLYYRGQPPFEKLLERIKDNIERL